MKTSNNGPVLLIGNPNSGKTSLFNSLTGLNAKVANYPGITVEAKEGKLKRFNQQAVSLIDLPGTYSLFPTAEDEELTIKALLGLIDGIKEHSLVVVVIDASHLRRGLYLYSQVIELGFKAIIALTMVDENLEFQDMGLIKELQKIVGTYVLPINQKDKNTLQLLRSTIDGILAGSLRWELNELPLLYKDLPSRILEVFVNKNSFDIDFIKKAPNSSPIVINRHIYIYGLLKRKRFKNDLGDLSSLKLKASEEEFLDNLMSHLPEQRFLRVDNWIKNIEGMFIPKKKSSFDADKILLNPLFGTLFSALLFFLLVESLFFIAIPLADGIADLFSAIGNFSSVYLPENSLIKGLFLDGIIQGLGSILSFVPLIALLFFLLGILEDSGYLARATFLFDKFLQSFGLCGRSLMPMLSGFACAVPAIMATRNISHKKERLITILTIPFLTCSARLPVFGLIIGSLFSLSPPIFGFIDVGALLFLVMYSLGIFMTLISSLIIAKVFPSSDDGIKLTIELPPYRMPKIKTVTIRVLERVWLFIRDVGSIILACTIIVWALFNLNSSGFVVGNIENTYAGMLGKTIEPLFSPIGLDWQIALGLLASFLAREAFISTMAISYGLTDNSHDLMQAFKEHVTPLAGLSLLIFFTLSMQCLSTLATTKRETRSFFWPSLQFFIMTTSAYFIAFITYKIGSFLGF